MRFLKLNETLEYSKQKVEMREEVEAFLELHYYPDYEPDNNTNFFSWNLTGWSNDTIDITLSFTSPE